MNLRRGSCATQKGEQEFYLSRYTIQTPGILPHFHPQLKLRATGIFPHGGNDIRRVCWVNNVSEKQPYTTNIQIQHPFLGIMS